MLCMLQTKQIDYRKTHRQTDLEPSSLLELLIAAKQKRVALQERKETIFLQVLAGFSIM